MQKNKNKNYIKVTQHKSIYMGKKREIKSKMCNRIKSAQQIRCAKTVYWDLINSNMNKRDVQEGCANGLYRVCTHSSNMGDENMNVLQLISLVNVYETDFVLRSLMAWGKKLLLSLSVFAIMLLKRLPDGSKQKWWLPGWFESLMILAALLLQHLGQRGESRTWDALS